MVFHNQSRRAISFLSALTVLCVLLPAAQPANSQSAGGAVMPTASLADILAKASDAAGRKDYVDAVNGTEWQLIRATAKPSITWERRIFGVKVRRKTTVLQ
jgi:hypothetical protein